MVSETGQRQALCLGVESFSPPPDPECEPELDRWPALPFAGERSSALGAELAEHGYRCLTVDADFLGAAELAGRLRSMITSAGPEDVLVVHLLSHGEVLPSGLYAIGADGVHDLDTRVENWLSWVEDFPDRPPTLFLLDLCYSGSATRHGWRLEVAAETARAWVIAATGPRDPAYNGYFSQAVVEVLGAIRRGELDVHPNLRHVPLGTVITRIGREVERLGAAGFGQRVQATPVSGEYPDLPFFANPNFHDDPVRRALSAVDVRVEPFVDVRLDADHFRDRASGLGPLRGRIRAGCFSGRAEELAALSDWLDRGHSPLAMVAGGPGSGKSALLGVLVCAAHPVLRSSTMDLWRHVAHRPSANGNLVAVHGRQCDVDEIAASIGRQLGIGALPPAKLCSEFDDRPGLSPVIVLDALDEAIDPENVLRDLVLPLAERGRARVLVGTRPWPELGDLRTAADRGGLVIDLDAVVPGQLRSDLAAYLTELLELSPEFGEVAFRPLRELFADTVAERLVTTEAGPWGGFLRAGMITHYALKSGLPRDPDAITAWLVKNLAFTLPDLFEAELAPARVGPLGRPLMVTLACARGEGMPLDVATRAVAALLDGTEPSQAEVRETLRRCRYYLRSMADDDGTTLYRLFHQALADHLHPEADRGALLDRILPPLSTPAGRSRRWHLAEPYMLRHASQHAIDAGRLDELLDDAEFLVHAEPEWLGPDLSRAQSRAGWWASAIYHTSVDQHRRVSPAERRQLLAIDAARHHHVDLTRRLANPAGLPALDWVPRWATDGQVNPALVATIGGVGKTGIITGLDCATLDGHPVVVTASTDRKLRLWDVREHKQIAEVDTETYGLEIACATVAGRQIVVSAGHTDAVDLWDLRTLRWLGRWGDPTKRFPHHGLSCAPWAGGTVAIRVGKRTNQPQILDLATGEPLEPPLYLNVREVACATVSDRDVLIVSGKKGPLLGGSSSIWICSSDTGRELAELIRRPDRYGNLQFTLAVTELDKRTVLVIVGGSTLAVIDLVTGDSVGDPVPCVGNASAIHCVHWGELVIAAISLETGGIQLWDLARRKPVGQRLLARAFPSAVTTVADGGDVRLVAVDGTRIRIWDLAAHLATPRHSGAHDEPVRRIDILDEAPEPLVVTWDDYEVRSWRLADGAPFGPPIRSAMAWRRSTTTLMGEVPMILDGHAIRYLADGRVSTPPWAQGKKDVVLATVVGGRPLAVVIGERADGTGWGILDVESEVVIGSTTVPGYNAGTVVCCGSLVAIADMETVLVWDLNHPATDPVPLPTPGRRSDWDLIRLAMTNVQGRAVLAITTRWASGESPRFSALLFDLATRERLPTHWPDSWACIPVASVGETLILGGVPGSQDVMHGFVARYDLREHRVLDEILIPGWVGAVAGTADGRLVVSCGNDVVMLEHRETE
ncbi:NACHT and WD repeat domain-containing protein [Amycolatopsis sp. EV170708-02-1]|uniref:NACHT and WD repeat domain-containing protein n=1 Tax=Amycolatopsis sp. EV170708-02-1 TaxID=2919322 RepID=UPI001F0BCDEC|nr:NACHT and WD repeat domain-containing protein [Amycolatopsis sp. EV170708-02-1]UMP00089.1 NACHT and WD repeat domain-containing protein [Amycolatopsis sp. EV170708-02-1]